MSQSPFCPRCFDLLVLDESTAGQEVVCLSCDALVLMPERPGDLFPDVAFLIDKRVMRRQLPGASAFQVSDSGADESGMLQLELNLFEALPEKGVVNESNRATSEQSEPAKVISLRQLDRQAVDILARLRQAKRQEELLLAIQPWSLQQGQDSTDALNQVLQEMSGLKRELAELQKARQGLIEEAKRTEESSPPNNLVETWLGELAIEEVTSMLGGDSEVQEPTWDSSQQTSEDDEAEEEQTERPDLRSSGLVELRRLRPTNFPRMAEDETPRFSPMAKSKPPTRWLVTLGSLLGLAAAAGLVSTGLISLSGNTNELPQAIPAAPSDSEVIRQTLTNYLSSPTPEAAAAYVRHPKVTLDRMKSFYSGSEVLWQKSSRFQLDEVLHELTMDGRRFMMSKATLEDEKPRFVAFEYVSEDKTWQIDWESWEDWAEISWKRFLAGESESAHDFRVLVQPGIDFYNKAYNDPSKYLCCRLTDPANEHTAYGYARIGSDAGLGIELLRQTRGAGPSKAVSAILTLRLEPQSHGTNQVVIDKVVSAHWIALD